MIIGFAAVAAGAIIIIDKGILFMRSHSSCIFRAGRCVIRLAAGVSLIARTAAYAMIGHCKRSKGSILKVTPIITHHPCRAEVEVPGGNVAASTRYPASWD